jgi:hypothetical protein
MTNEKKKATISTKDDLWWSVFNCIASYSFF